jgi:GTP-binding protein
MLRVVFLLVDIRHDPGANDKMMYQWIVNNGFNPVIIATKLDKIKRSQIGKHIKAIHSGLGTVEGTPIFPFSAQTKQGREEIWEFIDEMQEMFSSDE